MRYPLQPIGFRRNGSPIWPIMGGDGTALTTELATQIGTLTSRLATVAGDMEKARDTDTARWDALNAERVTTATTLEEIRLKYEAAERSEATEAALAEAAKATADMNAFLAKQRTPSKAALVGAMRTPQDGDADLGSFLGAVAAAGSRDAEMQAWGKARIEAMGGSYEKPDPEKATLGTAGPTGAYVIPNNLIRPVIETATAINQYRQLLTVIDGVTGIGVDLPYEGTAPARAVVAAWGTLKENLDFTVGRYQATMYTIARIFDVANQFLRRSQGAAEKLVRSKLARAFALGEAYYILNGTGTGQPRGLITSLEESPPGFVTNFTPSATTLAGSIATAIATGAGVLAGRFRQPDGVVLNAVDWWTMAAQGTDAAGFFFAPQTGPQGIDPTGGRMTIWGLPCLADGNMPTDKLIVGEWRSAELYIGDAYRVDTSDVAGTRWDYNLTGFRGEEEIGFNADPYVASGMFQEVNNVHA